MITLADMTNVVSFNEADHTYTRVSDGKILCGVTTMMRKMGLSANYEGVSDEVLAKAAERGSEIHQMCVMVDALDCPCDNAEANTYLRMRKERGLIPVANEYLVTDGNNIASCIDLVFTTEELQKENKVIIADIKCTSSIHQEPLGWQLSIYRELFEAQNPELEVVGLLGIWLPKPIYGNPKIFDAVSFPTEEIDRLINCFVSGNSFVTSVTVQQASTDVSPLQNSLVYILKKMDELKKKEAELKEQLQQFMLENGVMKIDNDDVLISYVKGGTSQRFDSTTFKKENPEMYDKYLKSSETKDSIRIKIK